MISTFDQTGQLLPREAYLDPAWLERERRALFDQSWTYICTEAELAEAGDFQTCRFLDHSLFVVRNASGGLQAFHNICRHRGCEVLEGSGNTGSALVCPYHRWTYRLDGTLRGVPNEQECFEHLEPGQLGLKPASVGVHAGLVYLNPSAAPRDSFAAWIANLDDFRWPHRFDDGSLEFRGSVTYEMRCNWKVFYENAVDGYHLGYLHDKTLGKLYPDRNVWKPAGRNVVWYSTERDGPPQSASVLSAALADGQGAQRLPGHEQSCYPGVVMLFPLTILSPSPWGFYVSQLEPVTPELTNMHTLSWAPAGSPGRFDLSAVEGPVRLSELRGHPLDSGSFQIEDMWIVEKIQRALRSPAFEIGPLAHGPGAESPITHFQANLLEFLGPAPPAAAMEV